MCKRSRSLTKMGWKGMLQFALVGYDGFLARRDECPGSLCHSPSVRVDVGGVNKNFNLGHNFQTISDRAFIFHMCILVTIPFTRYQNFYFLTLTLKFDLLLKKKTLTLAITFKPDEKGLSYRTCVFLVTRPFAWYHKFWPCDLDFEVWPTL